MKSNSSSRKIRVKRGYSKSSANRYDKKFENSENEEKNDGPQFLNVGDSMEVSKNEQASDVGK